MELILILLLSGFFCYAPAQEIEIKTVQTYAGNNETTLPVISGEERFDNITIEFDVKSEFLPDFSILFRFCDRDWNPYDNLFLRNTGENMAYNIELSRLPITVDEAEYHFRGSFPNSRDNVSFPFSGKWMYFVTASDDTSIVYASGRFIVVHKEIGMNTSLKHEKLEDETFFPTDLSRVFNITAEFELPDELHPSFVDHLEIIENQKIFYPVKVDRKFNSNRRYYYWDGNRKFTFTARDVRPGNEYRKVDTRDSKIFAGKNVTAHFNEIEYSRFFTKSPRDMNGGFIIGKEEVFPTYLNVKFEFKPPGENYGSIYLTGAFNNWQILPWYEMDNNNGIYSKTITLRRGAYDYQYVAADIINGRILNEDWYILEGNNYETTNVYHLLLYYSDPNYGGYDKIIGYKILLNK